MCLVISLFCLFHFHVKSLNFIFYVLVKSIVHQSYYQSIGSIYTSVDLKGNQLNWVGELFNKIEIEIVVEVVEVEITKTFDEKTKTNQKTPAQFIISIH